MTHSFTTLVIIALVAICTGPLITYLTLTRRYEGLLQRTTVFQQQQITATTRNLQRQLDEARREGEHARTNAAQALETMHTEHEQALAAQRTRHAKELHAAQAGGHVASLMEANLIDEMADKLALASATFHAKQQFSDARQANQLSIRGHSLALRMRSQLDAQRTEGAAA